MTPERYLGQLPGQFGRYARYYQGERSFWNAKRRRLPARYLVIGAGAIGRRHDPAGAPAPQ
jgi:hypothetical protein